MKQTTVLLFNDSMSVRLYKNLIDQLNKDLLLSGIDFKASQNWQPNELVKKISLVLKKLLTNQPRKINQLMYITDVSEKKINTLEETNLDSYISHLTQLILERIFKKVYIKQKLSDS